ncbi:hypothetical protein R3P38DRAFT_3348786 [Favolaschia claudopus]|uniref:Uncharacterized protein n=2 Tax=Favolaschia claudopus TaxID=2862362 RepID=A0AAW0CMK8_9AGAR
MGYGEVQVRKTGLGRKEHHRGGDLEHVRGQNQTLKTVLDCRRECGSAFQEEEKNCRYLKSHPSHTSSQNPWMLPAETAAIAATTQQADEYDQYFDDDHFTPDAEEEIARIEREALGDHSQMVSTSAQPVHTTPSLSAEQLKDASKRSRAHVFFSKRETFAYEAESDEEDMNSENEEDESEPRSARNKEKVVDSGKAWFTQPKGMPAWLYSFFRDTVQPLVFQKQGSKLSRPRTFSKGTSSTPGSFWIHPPEPVLALEGQKFHPPSLYQPRVFLWLPHFFVSCLKCPK